MTIEVEVMLYYNRPDPKWDLSKQQENDITKYINRLEFSPMEPLNVLDPPPYGFKGFRLNIDGTYYEIYREKIEKDGSLYGYDASRNIETYLVGTAPVTIRDHLTFF